ncbi:unnamed protein product, partial [Ascophyllum nodosum]
MGADRAMASCPVLAAIAASQAGRVTRSTASATPAAPVADPEIADHYLHGRSFSNCHRQRGSADAPHAHVHGWLPQAVQGQARIPLRCKVVT